MFFYFQYLSSSYTYFFRGVSLSAFKNVDKLDLPTFIKNITMLLLSFFSKLIFAFTARMLCGNHLNRS